MRRNGVSRALINEAVMDGRGFSMFCAGLFTM